jgi:hypothetical protein
MPPKLNAPNSMPVQLTGFLHGLASALRRRLLCGRLGCLAASLAMIGRFLVVHDCLSFHDEKNLKLE